jgi:hypothetical protein
MWPRNFYEGVPEMQNYHVFVDEAKDTSRTNSAPTYKIALIPSSRNGGAMGTKNYGTKESFISDLQRYLGYTDRAIERFFSKEDRHHTLMNHPLGDDDASYLGWLPE